MYYRESGYSIFVQQTHKNAVDGIYSCRQELPPINYS